MIKKKTKLTLPKRAIVYNTRYGGLYVQKDVSSMSTDDIILGKTKVGEYSLVRVGTFGVSFPTKKTKK